MKQQDWDSYQENCKRAELQPSRGGRPKYERHDRDVCKVDSVRVFRDGMCPFPDHRRADLPEVRQGKGEDNTTAPGHPGGAVISPEEADFKIGNSRKHRQANAVERRAEPRRNETIKSVSRAAHKEPGR